MRLAVLFGGFVLATLVAGASASTDNHHVKRSTPTGVPYDGRRVVGDTIDEAWVIGALPFTSFDNTCGFAHDYEEACPYTGSSAPDVVYSYAPTGNEVISIDLCHSHYDTKVFVYEDEWSPPGSPFACNDDFHFSDPCFVYTSKIERLHIFEGHTYYIVVDGYGNACGSFQIDVTPEEPCIVACPDGAVLEGEPPCQDEYYDEHNAGCGEGGGWTLVEAHEGDCATVCGESCTFLYEGSGLRDTDWFEMTCEGGAVSATCVAEFPFQFILIYGVDCENLQFDVRQGLPCEPVTLTFNGAPGQLLWLWVGASTFSGVPPSDYIFEVCGIEGNDTPTREPTWGSIKSLFK